MKPRVIILGGYGLNCEEETKYAFELAGSSADIIHINDLASGQSYLNKYQILVFPGGFSYGDDLGSGAAYANKIKNHLWEKVLKFTSADKLILGICNGFQILVNLGLLPALSGNYGERKIALIHNEKARYIVRFVDLEVTDNQTPWLKDLKYLSLPVAHGEGNFYADTGILKEIKRKKLIAMKYTKGEMSDFLSLPANPNGSTDDIAAITDESRRILGLMPHPERAISVYQMPNWPYLKEESKREGKKFPKEGPGISLFKNAVKYFS